MPRPAIACATQAAPNMHIKTDSQMVKDCRNGVMEFLLVNHPLDCPICDQAGECRLQEFATDYGRGYSRFIEEKNVKPKRTRLGPRVTLDDERCILCSRCIRFMQEVPEDDVLGFIDRGSYSTLTCYPGRELDSNYSLNTVDICPVGALTSTDFRFKMRVWFLKPVPSICAESSVGVNTEVWQREGKIYRITPRRNDRVNDTWMADSGRELYKQVESETRLKQFAVGGDERANMADALENATTLLKKGGVAIVSNGHASTEEDFLLKKLVDETKAPVYLRAHLGENDGLLISEDRTPNTRGALVTGLTGQLPAADLSDLGKAIEGGEVKVLLVLNEDVAAKASGLTESQLKKVKIVYLGTQANDTSKQANVVLPLLTVFERSGTFINQQFRLQKFKAVVPGIHGIVDNVHLLDMLLSLIKGEKPGVPPTVAAVWKELADAVEELEGMTWPRIPKEGILIRPDRWKDLPFPETKSRYWDPATLGTPHPEDSTIVPPQPAADK
jgi:NADH-quinone oxidoreductase subunit G